MSILSELQSEVASEIGSINATDDATAINRELNRGVRDILRRTHCYQKSATLTLTAGEDDYTMDSTILEIVDIGTSDSTPVYPLERVSIPRIRELRRATSSTSPLRYYTLAGANLLMLYPTPASGDTLVIYYVPSPTAMSSAAHDPSNATYGGVPVDYHWLIARYAMRFLASFDDDSSSAQGSRYWKEYMSGIADMYRELPRKGGPRVRVATLGSSRVYVPSDPSTDY